MSVRRRDPSGRAAAWMLGGLLLLFFGALLDPRNALATRDMVEFHLPLRLSWSKLVAAGSGIASLFPQWDPFAHGGQPLLSNPNYGALYPPAWLALALPVTAAVAWLAVLHAAVAAFGAARLARAAGADRPAALLAGLAWACGANYLSLLHSLPLALGMSWLPWALALAIERTAAAGPRGAGIGASGASGPRHFDGNGVALAAVTALLLVTGDPVLAAMFALAVALVAALPPRRLVRNLRALAPPLLLGGALAAIQLLPTAARVADSPRADGLPFASATNWSLTGMRLPELFFPAVYGDPARIMENLYFGWGIHDLDFPYLLLLSVGMPLGLLGLVGIGRRRVAGWALWTALLILGVLLALGRHSPVYRLLYEALPGFGALRYPEKFALLALVALLLAGVLEWRRILDEREAAPARSAELPAALAFVLTSVAVAAAAALHLRPASFEPLLQAHAGVPLSAADLARALDLFREVSLAATSFALATATLFVLARWSRLSRRALEAGMLVLVAGELWVNARPLLRTHRASALLAPPPAIAALGQERPRIFSTEIFQSQRADPVVKGGDVRLSWARAPIDRLDSRAANLFGLSYALDKDFDLTLTPPATRALELYRRLRDTPTLAHRLLGAWSVERLVIRRAAPSIVEDIRRGQPRPALVRIARNSFAIPEVRFVGAYRTFGDSAEAERAATEAGLPLNVEEFLIAAPPPPALGVARVVATRGLGDRREIEYEGDAPSLVVVASTFDRRWRAALDDGSRVALYETAGGYIAAVVPAGRHRLALRCVDPWFGAGAAISGAALAVLLAAAVRARRATGRAAQAA